MNKQRIIEIEKKHAKVLQVGNLVYYHAVIGGEITSGPHAVIMEPIFQNGRWVVFIEGHSGYVSCAAVLKPDWELSADIRKYEREKSLA